jgi:ferredoxin-type protein NapF
LQFLRGDFRGARSVLRPPWACGEGDFIDRCTACGACISACVEHILVQGRGSFPTIDFQLGACTFCEACVRACKTGALNFAQASPWPYKADFGDRCLAAMHHVVCQSCGDACDTYGVRFIPTFRGVPNPTLDIELCTGCGACVAVCPAAAVNVVNLGE